eukprot:CAMPEP_0118719104 /NCGR_PEP_ID=MMETSP0800-20121206/29227_1 /TAXON_ID=210618 ORGANISM="Striatella unipunctata, Strain CCMP2910" /NCGR_SAMPLE_ID=MMETSP0800 /ASSEMBLY_ACC=CAM_ASM_000638 /LENGTH=149 /DNA_ID=CAMNT_0006626311 /DNA_START=1 /DNA_END=446 /DNA_ORIENTATION=+
MKGFGDPKRFLEAYEIRTRVLEQASNPFKAIPGGLLPCFKADISLGADRLPIPVFNETRDRVKMYPFCYITRPIESIQCSIAWFQSQNLCGSMTDPRKLLSAAAVLSVGSTKKRKHENSSWKNKQPKCPETTGQDLLLQHGTSLRKCRP